jgi:hypothetical protein
VELVTRGDGLVDAEQAAALARVQAKTIHTWVARGHLVRRGVGMRHGGNGQSYRVSLFDPGDVIRVERQLRKSARRIILPRAM